MAYETTLYLINIQFYFMLKVMFLSAIHLLHIYNKNL